MNQSDKIWDIANTWQAYCSPARPDVSEVTIVEKQLKAGMKILLLGSTPEYRDLFIKYKCHVTLVDYSKDNFEAMTRLMKEKPISEKFIEANWLDMPVADHFDLIVGDHVINLLPLAEWQGFLENLRSLLCSSGKLLQRVVIRTIPYTKTEDAIFSMTSQLSGPELFSRVFYDLLMLSMDNAEQSVCLADAWKCLEQINAAGLLTPVQFQHFKSLSWKDSQLKAYFISKENIVEEVEKVFHKNTMIAGDIYYNELTFFILSEN